MVGFLAAHLDDEVDLDDLAGVAHASRFHFHRMYRQFFGETAEQTLRRMRLNRAASELGGGDEPIAAIAGRAGYGSTEAFSRAFSAAYGRSPSSFRALRQPPPGAVPGIPGTTPMTDALSRHEITVEPYPRLRLVGLPHRGSYLSIGATFGRVTALAIGAGLVPGPATRCLGVYLDDPETVREADLRSFAGFTLPDARPAPAGLEEMVLDGGEAANLVFTGPYADLHLAYRHLYGTWLPASGREPADVPVFEEYLNDPRSTPPSELRTCIRLPLRVRG